MNLGFTCMRWSTSKNRRASLSTTISQKCKARRTWHKILSKRRLFGVVAMGTTRRKLKYHHHHHHTTTKITHKNQKYTNVPSLITCMYQRYVFVLGSYLVMQPKSEQHLVLEKLKRGGVVDNIEDITTLSGFGLFFLVLFVY